MAHAAFGLINSTPHSGLIPDEAMRGVLHGWRWALGLALSRALRRRWSISASRVVGQRQHAGPRGRRRPSATARSPTSSGALAESPGAHGPGAPGPPPAGPARPGGRAAPARATARAGAASTHGSPSTSQATWSSTAERVDARVDPGAARAGRAQLTAVGQQLDAGLLGLLDQAVRQLAGQQRGELAGLGRPPPRRTPRRLTGVELGHGRARPATRRPGRRRRRRRRRVDGDRRRSPRCARAPGARVQVGLGVRRLLDRAHPRPAPPGRRPATSLRRGGMRERDTVVGRALTACLRSVDQVEQLVVARARSAPSRRGRARRRPASACGAAARRPAPRSCPG